MVRILLLFTIISFHLRLTLNGQTIEIKNTDPRYIGNGSELPSEHYADQPYIIVCDDGSWLCTMTTSSGTESVYMNHIVSTKSYDQGKTWTRLTDVEPSGVPQSAWAVPMKVPGGRIYVFYNFNRDHHPGLAGVMSAPFAFRYSDDHGKTWSGKQYEVPMRKTRIDYDNYSNGTYQFFWSIDKPVVTTKAAYITFSKLLFDNPEGKGFYKRAEGFILKSSNILMEKDPGKIRWELLPEGETGIINPQLGQVQAEHNTVILENGNLYVVYRTHEGHMAYSKSTDDGKTFSLPQPLKYAGGGLMPNPRACPKIHKTNDGKYLLWYHNNFRKHTYQGRNPAWLSGGIEKNGEILWSQPEIVLYDMDPEAFGMSYPDFIEQDGKFWIVETQKSTARVHEVDMNLLNGLWNQSEEYRITSSGLIADAYETSLQNGTVNFPPVPNLMTGGGFTLELWFDANELSPGQEILSTFGPKHKGLEVSIGKNRNVEIRIHDGEMRDADGPYRGGQTFSSDAEAILKDQLHHVAFIIDGASGIASVIVNGILSDGSPDNRPYGWGRIHTFMQDLNDTYKCSVNPDFKGQLRRLRVYNRYLTTSEVIENYHAGLK